MRLYSPQEPQCERENRIDHNAEDADLWSKQMHRLYPKRTNSLAETVQRVVEAIPGKKPCDFRELNELTSRRNSSLQNKLIDFTAEIIKHV